MSAERRSDIVFFLALVVLLYIAWVLRKPLLTVYAAALLAVIFMPLVHWVQRGRIRSWSPSRGAAVLILLGVFLGAVGIFLTLALPPIVRDTRDLIAEWPTRAQQMRQRLQGIPLLQRFNLEQLPQYLGQIAAQALRFFQGAGSAAVAVITLVVLTAYFIVDGERAYGWGLSLVPVERRPRLQAALAKAEQRVQRWILGQFLLMLILGTSSALVFGLLGIRYFYALGVFAGLANFIPILGPIATVVLAGLVAAVDGWSKVLGVLIFYVVYQQVENAYLTPRIMRATLQLAPSAVLVSLLIGGELGGVLGALIAVPSAALFSVLVREYLVQDPAVDQAATSTASRRARVETR